MPPTILHQLSEAAKSLDDAIDNDVMAVVLDEDEHGRKAIVLFSAETLTRLVVIADKNKGPLQLNSCVRGVLVIERSSRALDANGYTIAMSYAEQKYGPLLYELAMALVYPSVLFPSWIIKPGALKLWKRMLMQRIDIQKIWIFDLKSGKRATIGDCFPFEKDHQTQKVYLKILDGHNDDDDELITKSMVQRAMRTMTPDEKATLTHMFGYKKNNPTLLRELIDSGESFLERLTKIYGHVSEYSFEEELRVAGEAKFDKVYYK